ncbi:hypothetical protein GOBAR_DD33189 [Gossypium barbadense]|nr:hypothetical protein GOBAR_DD33189 [Gossypium barbadense]
MESLQEQQGGDVAKPGWRNFLSFIVETDLQAGASHGYELLWVVLIGLVFTLIIQSLAANLGVSTGKHLSEKCKAEYPRMVKYCLWILAEIAVIAADIPEVIGTTFGLNILFNIPVWVRKLEMLIAVLVFVMVGCFFREMSYVKPPASGVVKGMFFPILNGQGATGDAIALLGTISSFTQLLCSAEKYQALLEVLNVLGKSSKALYAVALLASGQSSTITGTYAGQFIVQIFSNREWHRLVCGVFNQRGGCLSVYAVCTADNISSANQKRCNDLNLNSASFLLQGFLNLHMKKWVRNIMTRCIAITPSLIVSIIGGSQGAGRLIIIASVRIYLRSIFLQSIPLTQNNKGIINNGFES